MTKHKFLSLQYFNSAHLDLQSDEVFNHGDFLDIINGIVIYTYSNYIVECWYNRATNMIEEMNAISITEASDKYISDLEIGFELSGIPLSN